MTCTTRMLNRVVFQVVPSKFFTVELLFRWAIKLTRNSLEKVERSYSTPPKTTKNEILTFQPKALRQSMRAFSLKCQYFLFYFFCREPPLNVFHFIQNCLCSTLFFWNGVFVSVHLGIRRFFRQLIANQWRCVALSALCLYITAFLCFSICDRYASM